MKKYIPLMLLGLFLTFSSRAQYVSIPDNNFATWLRQNGFASVMTGNTLDTSSAIVHNTHYISCGYSNIASLEGIEYFPNLDSLETAYNDLTTIPAITSPTFVYLSWTYNPIGYNTLPAWFATSNLQTLIILGDDLHTLSNLPPNLIYLNCTGNLFTTWPALPNNLQYLLCGSGSITYVPTLPSTLTYLAVPYNPTLTQLPISLPSGIDTIICNQCQITYMPPLPPGLVELECSQNAITSFSDISFPSTLTYLDCDNNQISYLPYLPTGLLMFSCQHNLLQSIPDFSQLTSMYYFAISYNPLTQVLSDFPNSTNLYYIYCQNDSLFYLPTVPFSAGVLNCANNQLTSISLAVSSINLTSLICSNNQLTSLPDISSDYNLGDLECSYNQITSIPEFGGYNGISNFFCDHNPGLTCLPTLGTISSLNFSGTAVVCLSNYGTVTTSVPPLSTVPLCGVYNPYNCPVNWNISGQDYYDANSNCTFDYGDQARSYIKNQLYKNGVLQQTTFSGGEGFYSFDVPGNFGTYTVQVDTSQLPFGVECPTPALYTDNITNAVTWAGNNNFALRCRENGFDVGVWNINYDGFARPGTATTVNVVAGDISQLFGASGVSGQVTLTFSGNVSYGGPVAGSLTPTTVSGNTIIWNVANFTAINDYTAFNIILNINPNAPSGTYACVDVAVTPLAGDYNPGNNTSSFCFEINSSFDPNEKEVSPSGRIDTSQNWLTYTIRFQNTGTDTAFYVYIIDTLSSNLDSGSIQLLASSDKVITQVMGSVLKFSFNDIDLVDSASSQTLSRGYIQYKIKQKPGLPVGTVINNTANIYFDLNSPVRTNTTHDTIALPCATTYDTISRTICQGDTFYIGSGAFTQSGTFNYTLTNQAGCDSLVTLSLIVRQLPGSGFVVAPAVCINLPDTVIYTGTFNGTPAFNWSFGGATVQWGTGSGPYGIFWPAAGTKLVTLQVTSNGCASVIDSNFVTVDSIPTSTFTAATGICVGQTDTLTYTGNAQGIGSFIWNFDYGNTLGGGFGPAPLQVEWDTAGVHYVTLLVELNGCSSAIDTLAVTVKPVPASTFTATSPVCPGGNSTIIYTGTGGSSATLNYNFNGGTVVGNGVDTQKVYWVSPQLQTITLQASLNGCTGPVDTQYVSVYHSPAVSLNWDSMVSNGSFQVLGNDTVDCNLTVNPVLKGGYPAGGVYSGNYVFNNTFYIDSAMAVQGPVTVFYSYTDSITGCSNFGMSAVYINVCLGIPNINGANLFALYPNPADDYTTLSFDATYTGATIMVKDITGRQLYQTQLTTSPQQIPTGNLPPGVYLVTMFSNGEVGAKLLVKE